ncbi:MAG: hypothetical protein E7672_02520 [Ruminococcaceae bacterium]|nr:hypothetical protein [Oscillospiraceae bacterium]
MKAIFDLIERKLPSSIIRASQDRLVNKRWGVFNHYIWNNKAHPERTDLGSWSDTIETFDTERLAKTLHEIGAGYYFFTIILGTEYMATPNPTYEKICGVEPGVLCPKRDLVADLYNSLSKYNIDLYLYFNAYTPLFSYIPEKLSLSFVSKHIPNTDGYNPKCGGTMQNTPTEDYAQNWASVLEDTAVRYGDKVCGWWIDSCYSVVGWKFENMAYLHRAIKKGNPAALSAFNNGIFKDIKKWYPEEEFTCGEFNNFGFVPESRYIDGAQSHMLIPLGSTWAEKGVQHDHAYFKEYLSKLEAVGCPLTFDIYVGPDGSLDEEQLEGLCGL